MSEFKVEEKYPKSQSYEEEGIEKENKNRRGEEEGRMRMRMRKLQHNKHICKL